MGRRLKAFFADTGEYYLTKTPLEQKASHWQKYYSLVTFAALVPKFVVPKFDLNLPKYMWECVWNYSLKAILGGFRSAG
jgi:hypothetical protein